MDYICSQESMWVLYWLKRLYRLYRFPIGFPKVYVDPIRYLDGPLTIYKLRRIYELQILQAQGKECMNYILSQDVFVTCMLSTKSL